MTETFASANACIPCHTTRHHSGRIVSLLVALVTAATAFVLISSGEPSRVGAAAATSSYVAVTPTRLFDTRGGAALQAKEVREFQITEGVVPAAATAVMLNVTATRSLGNGYLQVFPTGRAGVDTSSTLNLDFAGQTIPNGAFAPLGDGGKISIYTTFPTDILIDVFGYFVPAASATAGRFVPLTPTRILDTRINLGWTAPVPIPPPATPPPATPTPPGNPGDTKNCLDFATQAAAQVWFDTYFPFYGDIAKLDGNGDGIACESRPLMAPLRSEALVSARTTIPLQVSGAGGVPTSGVSAVVMNVTAAGPTSDGFVQVSPSGITVGDTSNLNPEKNRTIANLVVVPLGVGGRVDVKTYLYELTGTVDLLADVVGYFTDGTAPSSTAGLFVPIAPTRALDTRQPSPRPEVGAGQTVDVNFASVAPGAAAIAGNLTSAGGGPGGFLQLAPAIGVPGASSSLNTSYEDQTIANAVVSPITAGGTAQIYTYGPTHMILDVTGWFTG